MQPLCMLLLLRCLQLLPLLQHDSSVLRLASYRDVIKIGQAAVMCKLQVTSLLQNGPYNEQNLDIVPIQWHRVSPPGPQAPN